MTPSKPNVNAKTIREALDSTEARMYLQGSAITRIMQVTGKSYKHVRETLELAGLTNISEVAKRSA